MRARILKRCSGSTYLFFIFHILFFISLISCSSQKQISKIAKASVLSDSALQHAHLGISIFDPSSNKYLYNFNGSHYFVPASNIKIITCYAAMKYLGDSVPGIRYNQTDNGITLFPTGDPSLLHADFRNQPVINFLQKETRPLFITGNHWQADALGAGWSWGDYNFYYSAERSVLPVYGNILTWVQERADSTHSDQSAFIYSIPEINWKVRFNPDTSLKSFYIQRNKDENVFVVTEGKENKKQQQVPFVTHGLQSALELLKDTIGKEIVILDRLPPPGTRLTTIFSQPTDSLLKPMMHHSDNFFAEQLLLMVSNEKLGVLSDDKIIDTLLRTDLSDLPQKPGWADGSGLSRYNLFTPQDFVTILKRMRQEFGMERMKRLFPTGGIGTLGNLYQQDSGYIYAKTGTLSGVVALSGFLYTRKNKLLIFSVLVNNHRGSAIAIRKQVETFLSKLRNTY